METRDYLLRQIEALAKGLAAIAGRIEKGDEEEAFEGIVDGLRVLVGVSPDVLSRMSADALRPMLTVDGRLLRPRTLAVVEFMRLASLLAPDPGVAHQRKRCIVRLLAMLAADGETEHSPALIAEFSRQVYLNQLDGRTLERLVVHFEGQGDFARAEDAVHAWLDVDVQAGFDAGMAFYERMWSRPEAQKKAGGLESADVLEGIGELQRRAGRK